MVEYEKENLTEAFMARVEKYNGYPAIMVNGKPYPPMMATIRTNAQDSLRIDKE